MPRPEKGYQNKAGLAIPGAGDIIKRFQPSEGLQWWRYQQGKAGKEYNDYGAANIGTVTHAMAEMDMRGQSMDEIDGYLTRTASMAGMSYDDRNACVRCFAGYRSWRTSFSIRPVLQEEPLVSEKYQYGGTPDLIGETAKGLTLVDLKTSSKGQPYLDHPVHMASHGRLWLEHNPSHPLTGGYILLLLPKDGSQFRTVTYTQEQIEPYWRLFETWRGVYDLDKACQNAKALEGQTVAVSAHAQPTSSKIAPTASARQPNPRQKTPDRLSYSPQPPMSMAECLRAYGHVGAIA